MIKDEIRLLCLQNGRYGIGYDVGEVEPGNQEHKYVILREAISAKSARAYAAGLIDGVNLGEYFRDKRNWQPINPSTIKCSESFIDAAKQDE